MRAIERHITYPGRGEWIDIYNLADIHGGSIRCKEKLLRKLVRQIADEENSYWIFGGDGGEYINRKDPRFRASELAPWLHGVDDIAACESDWLEEELSAIAPKCLAVHSGNHEDANVKHYERNIYADLVRMVKARGNITEQVGLGYRGFLRVCCKRSTHTSIALTIFSEHGWGGGRYPGGDANNADRIFSYFDADVYLCGHRHKALVKPHVSIRVIAGKAREVNRIAANVGTFRGNDCDPGEENAGEYGDAKGYPPGHCWGVRIRFQPDTFELRGEAFPY